MEGEGLGPGSLGPGWLLSLASFPARLPRDTIDKLAFISLPLGLALGSPIFPSGCEGKLGVALESLQGLRDLT